MSAFSQAVLAIGLIGTIALIVYVKLVLPRKLEQRSVEAMRAFSTAIELRFRDHMGRTDRVSVLTRQLGVALRLSTSQRHDLAMATQLRDIGLCAIPYAMVNAQSSSTWTEAQRITYDRHAEVGGAMLELVPSLEHLAEPVRFHHARQPGYPVPDGVRPSFLAEILNVATSYVWLELRDGTIPARAAIEAGAGTLYDKTVVEALMQVTSPPRIEEPLTPAAV